MTQVHSDPLLLRFRSECEQIGLRKVAEVDLMEPMPPVADRKVLELVQRETFAPGDFVLLDDGYVGSIRSWPGISYARSMFQPTLRNALAVSSVR